MIILNHIIARVCSLQSNSDLFKLNPSFIDKFQHVIIFSRKLKKTEGNLLETLHQYNIDIQEKKVNNAIQNIRRDIFNDRPIKSKDIFALEEKEQIKILDKINTYAHLRNIYNKELLHFEKLFLNEQLSKRYLIKKIYQNSNSIKNGLLLSSISLLESSSKFKELNLFPSKKEKQIEIGLLKYITRSMFKPTPFSSFTHINYGKFSDQLNTNFFSFMKNENFQIRSHIRINNKILQSLKSYINIIPEIYNYLDVIINPSLIYIKETNRYKVLINKNNYEFFQFIEKNTILELIINFFSKSKKVKFIYIVNYLKDIVKAEETDINIYVKKLVNIGILVFDLHVSGSDVEWIDKLHIALSKIPLSKTQEILINLLINLNILRLDYETNFFNIKARKKILNETSSLLNETLIKLQRTDISKISDKKPTIITFKKEKIFLEDTTVNYKIIINKCYFKQLIQKLNILINYCSQFSFSMKEQRKLYDFYKVSYNEESIPLLSFYEDYYRFLKKNNFASENKKDNNINKYFSLDIFNITQKSEDLITFCLKNKKINLEQSNIPSSFSMFFQLSNIEKKFPDIIVNSISCGYGRMASRFLYMFEEKFKQDIKDLNKALNEEIIYSEINDASFFNANLHPPLFPYECTIPGGNTNTEDAKQLKVNQLSVKKDITNEKLILFDTKSGKQIYIHDSCFQGLKGRSQLFNLLLNFTDKINPAYRLLLNDLNKLYKKTIEKNVMLFPRVVYENTIVLQRKFWIINNGIPLKDHNENEVNYYLKVNIWRKKLKIPSQIYLTLNYLRKTEVEKYTRDDYKPQFIDFENTIFIPLIIKLFNKAESIKIVETLPGIENTINYYNNRKFATEFLVHWYNGKNYEN